MRILIVESDLAIARFIEQQLVDNFDCDVHIATNCDDAKVEMHIFLPQLLLCDVSLKAGEGGLELVSELKRQYVFEVIFLSSSHSKATILQATKMQPVNYLFKPLGAADIFAVITLVKPHITANAQLGRLRYSKQSPRQPFSATELEVLRRIVQRKTTREISEELFLSPYTVKNHRHNICRKLGLKAENNALLKWALENSV